MNEQLAPDRLPMILRLRGALVLSVFAAIPFLFTPIPPLGDVPGHIGRFAVQIAPAGDPLLRYFSFHWALTLNLASDLIIQAFHPWIGIIPLTWILCASTPVLTTLALISISRVANSAGASSLPWALIFVFNFPFLWGFLNYAFTLALGLLEFAAWVALAGRPRARMLMAVVATPMLLVGHGVAGFVSVGLIASYEFGQALRPLPGRTLGEVLKRVGPAAAPVAAAIITIMVWKTFGASDVGKTLWLWDRKRDALLMMLRDQSRFLDIASVAACVLLAAMGWWWGARLRGGPAAAIVFVATAFMATPSLLSGSDQIDTRLAPLIPMLFFALQDWSGISSVRRRCVFVSGCLLLAGRFALTTASFVDYGRRYEIELSALERVPPGARILNLSKVYCKKVAWRSNRLEHLANLATPLRGAWVNAHWSIQGLQLLQVRYSPSADYTRDPSHLIWPERCIDFHESFAERDRHTLEETIPVLPLEKADFLWLVGERIRSGGRDPRLQLVWADDISELYAITHKIDTGRDARASAFGNP